jgi:hypothetical protein
LGVQGAIFQKSPLVAEGSTMLVHPLARPWGFPTSQTASQILTGCTCRVLAEGKGLKVLQDDRGHFQFSNQTIKGRYIRFDHVV